MLASPRTAMRVPGGHAGCGPGFGSPISGASRSLPASTTGASSPCAASDASAAVATRSTGRAGPQRVGLRAAFIVAQESVDRRALVGDAPESAERADPAVARLEDERPA